MNHEEIEVIHRRLTERSVQPLTYKYERDRLSHRFHRSFLFRNLNKIITQQRMRDRSLKTQEEQEARELKKRNRKILQTATQHFPDIDILTRREKHKDAIEQLARPRARSAHPRS